MAMIGLDGTRFEGMRHKGIGPPTFGIIVSVGQVLEIPAKLKCATLGDLLLAQILKEPIYYFLAGGKSSRRMLANITCQ